MKKIVWGLSIVVLIIVGVIVVGPSIIDWNAYKDDVSQKVKVLTGRDLKISGDVQVTLFPAPTIIANDVSFSNMQGAATETMVKLERAEVRIALRTLLVGQIKVETVRLIKPIIELELAADGRKNWEIKPLDTGVKNTSRSSKKRQTKSEAEASVSSVVLDDFTIVDGTLNYRDSAHGTIERIEGLNAHVEAASLIGPFQSKGTLTLRNTPLSYDISVGEVIKSRTLPLNMKFSIGESNASLQIGGTILDLTGEPKFKGSVKGEGKNLGQLIEAITRNPTPPALSQLFSIEGNISGSALGAEINNLSVQLADANVTGDVSVAMGAAPRFSINLAAEKFDLDKLLNTQQSGLAKVKTAPKTKATISVDTSSQKDQSTMQASNGVMIPKNLSGSVIVSVEALVYRGQAISDVLINSELGNGVAKLSQFSAQLPGGSEVTLYGDLSTPKGAPQFLGNIEAHTNDLQKITEWLGVKVPNIPKDRFRKVDFSSAIMLTPNEIQVQSLNLKFDSSRFTGAATVALRSRLGFGANLTLDQINADAYIPIPSKSKPLIVSTNSKGDNATAGKQNTKKAESISPFKGVSALAGFDANVLLKIKRLQLKGEQLKGVAIDASLYDGSLDIRKFNVAQFAGATLVTSGKIEGLRDIPIAQGLRVNIKSKNLTPIMRLFKTKLPFKAAALGKTSLDLRVDGSFLSPKVKAKIKIAGVKIQANGKISVLPIRDTFDLNVNLSHPDLARLLRTFGSKYRPSGKIGGLTLASHIKGNPKVFSFDKMSGKIDKINFGGLGQADFSGVRPRISADLKLGALSLDPFLPATQNANLAPELWKTLKRGPVVWPSPIANVNSSSIINVANRGRWSADPIDLSVLKSFDADIALKMPIVIFSKYLLEKVDLIAEIKNGTLIINRLVAQLFGGQVQGNAKIVSGNSNQISSAFNISGIKIADALRSVTGKATASGFLDANLDFTTTGKSVAGMVGSLGGTGGFSMKGVDVSASVKGSAFSGVYSLLSSLNKLGSSRSGNKADVAATFQIARGVARTNDLKLASQLGNGFAAGTVDLVGWLLNLKGQVDLQQNALTQILQAKLKRGASPVGFTLLGPLDAPNVKVDTGALLGSSVPILGADALLNKAPKKVQRLLKGLLGGGNTPPPTSGTAATGNSQPPPRTTQQQKPTKLNARDLLKGLFN